jgi:hypothetical protein
MVFKSIVLTRPLAIIDLETAGTDAKEARIVELSVLKILPDGTNTLRTRRINPGFRSHPTRRWFMASPMPTSPRCRHNGIDGRSERS